GAAAGGFGELLLEPLLLGELRLRLRESRLARLGPLLAAQPLLHGVILLLLPCHLRPPRPSASRRSRDRCRCWRAARHACRCRRPCRPPAPRCGRRPRSSTRAARRRSWWSARPPPTAPPAVAHPWSGRAPRRSRRRPARRARPPAL